MGKNVWIRDEQKFMARRKAIRHVNAELRRLWKFHETSSITHIRGLVIRIATGLPIHQVRIDRESAANGWKRALIFEGPRS